MFRYFWLLALLFTFSFSGFAQEDTVAVADSVVREQKQKKPDSVQYWTNGGNFRLNFRNVTLRNWNAGGNSNIALGSEVRLNAERKKDEVTWTNTLLLAYGLVNESNTEFPWKKNDDRILLNSKYSRKINDKWSLSGLMDFRTQFDAGFRYRGETRTFLSEFMAPGFLLGSMGLTLKPKKNDWYTFTMAPYTGKLTFVWNDSLSNAGAFGVDPGEKSRLEAGSSLTSTINRTILENVKVTSRLNLFAGYESFTAIDVNWEALIEFKVNKYITSSISTVLIYDEDIQVNRDDGTTGPAIQFQNVINIGLNLDISSSK
jgi:hypothetical protein